MKKKTKKSKKFKTLVKKNALVDRFIHSPEWECVWQRFNGIHKLVFSPIIEDCTSSYHSLDKLRVPSLR